MKPPRSELEFAAFLTYCPRDTSAIRVAKNFVVRLKENRVARGNSETASALVARRLRERDDVDFRGFLGPDVALVPVPRSSLRRKDALWPALEIAKRLEAEELGSNVIECLRRRVAVPKAATASSAERPKARVHFDSLDLIKPLELPGKVTLVDDVITRGAQLFGAAWKIWSVRPDIEVRAFAVVRTVSAPTDFTRVDEPCVGRIEWRAEECRRRP